MNKIATVILQIVILLIGLGALAFMLREPFLEGRNANATAFDVYFKDPFLVYAYAASIPFFVALYQAFRVLSQVRHNSTFSQSTVRAMRIIKYCALGFICLVAISVVFMINGERDDRPAGLFMRLLLACPSIVIAAAATMFEQLLQNATAIKSENDLTV